MMLAAGFVRAAVAQDAAVGVATYIEVMPQSMEAAVTSLKTEAAASRKDDGCQDVQVLREIGRDKPSIELGAWFSPFLALLSRPADVVSGHLPRRPVWPARRRRGVLNRTSAAACAHAALVKTTPEGGSAATCAPHASSAARFSLAK
jgi:hypothetical protein